MISGSFVLMDSGVGFRCPLLIQKEESRLLQSNFITALQLLMVLFFFNCD